jgi:hypothetical protein
MTKCDKIAAILFLLIIFPRAQNYRAGLRETAAKLTGFITRPNSPDKKFSSYGRRSYYVLNILNPILK